MSKEIRFYREPNNRIRDSGFVELGHATSMKEVRGWINKNKGKAKAKKRRSKRNGVKDKEEEKRVG